MKQSLSQSQMTIMSGKTRGKTSVKPSDICVPNFHTASSNKFDILAVDEDVDIGEASPEYPSATQSMNLQRRKKKHPKAQGLSEDV